jgi:hypothetical protein
MVDNTTNWTIEETLLDIQTLLTTQARMEEAIGRISHHLTLLEMDMKGGRGQGLNV